MAANPNTAGNQTFNPSGDPALGLFGNWMNDIDDHRDLPITVELGTTGVPIYAGRVYDEWDPRLQGNLADRVYREMTTTPIVAGILFGIDQQIRKAAARSQVKPADGADPESVEVRLVESALHDMSMSWAEVLSQNFSMIPYGWSYSEIVYKRRLGYSPAQRDPITGNPLPSSKHKDGLYGWRKIALRTQETRWRWNIDNEGGIQGMWQSAPPDYVPRFIPIERALLFRTSVTRPSPEGLSCLRGAYEPWYLAKRIARIEAIGLERDLAGLPVVKVPPEILRSDASDDQKSLLKALQNLVTNVRRDEKEGVVFPLEYDDKGNARYAFELMSSGGTRNFDTDAIIGRYNQQVAMTVLADFIMLGHENVGSYSLGVSKLDLFIDALQAWLDVAAGVYNNHAIPRLMAVNGFDPERSPKIVPGKITEADLGTVGTLLQQLAAAGAEVFPNDELLAEIFRQANLPDDIPSDARATDLFGPGSSQEDRDAQWAPPTEVSGVDVAKAARHALVDFRKEWEEGKHSRVEGGAGGGEFTSGPGGGSGDEQHSDESHKGELADAIQAWTDPDSYYAVSAAAAQQLEGNGKAEGWAGDAADRIITEMKENPSDEAPELYRGIGIRGDTADFLKRYQEGSTVDLGLSSFSGDHETARDFAGENGGTDDDRAIFTLASGGHGLDLSDASYRGEEEWIVTGRFRVVSVDRDEDLSNEYSTTYDIGLEQVA